MTKKSNHYRKKSSELSVSIIICAHNELVNLKDHLKSWLYQDYENFEVIIVNDRSVDGSLEFLTKEELKSTKLRVIHVDAVPAGVNPKKYGLALGINKATKEIILVSDADCCPVGKSWCRSMVVCFDEGVDLVLGYSPYHKEKSFLNAFIRYETLLSGIQYMGFALLGMPYMGVGRNLAYRRSTFIKTGGFEGLENITGGDDDLFVNRHATARNTRVCMNPHSFVYSKPKQDWLSFYFQKLRHLSVGRHYRMRHKLFLGLFSLSYILCWVIGFVLLLIYPAYYGWVFIGLILRHFILAILILVVGVRLGDKMKAGNIFFLDILYVFYYISTGLRALTIKKVKWTN